MLDIADRRSFRLGTLPKDFTKPLLAFEQRQLAQIVAVGEQKVKGEENKIVGTGLRKRGLHRRKIRVAGLAKGDDLAVDDRIRELGCSRRNGCKFISPVQTCSGLERDIALFNPHLDAISVEFYFVQPAIGKGRTRRGFAKLRRDKVWHFGFARANLSRP